MNIIKSQLNHNCSSDSNSVFSASKDVAMVKLKD